ncbi:ral guanine nucleotide dissociation stimulator-like 2 isoform X2 [Spea bombifrons]|uniref:ral guanine nucleotide dissociation stimulator-like 2 isoform X2 n=1 Tax=Spea bombifrons TaxID=233779 RepID=UPI00234A5ACF|nr:ral guanine nucleotide dissociation stimulator-like 2 isoform X2 [Spea bombifrons]
MIPRTLRRALEEARREHRAREAQTESLQYDGEEERDGVVYSVYLRTTSTHQTPVRVLALRAGTLVRIVLHLLDARTLGDTSYIPAFLATYRAFTSTAEVLHILLGRLESDAQKPRGEDGGKDDDISSLFCGWMSQYPEDFASLDPDKRKRLSLCLSKLMKSNLVAKLQELSVEQKEDQELLPTLAEETSPSDPLDILAFQAGHVAEQLTSMEATLFLRVVPYECLGSVWSRRGRGGEQGDRCHSVKETVRHFNRLSGAVTSSCVKDPQLRPQQRARVIEKWVRVAEECWSLRNFSSVYAIISALQSTAVHRLKKVWAETSREIQRSYQEISEVFSEKDNYARMRELLFQSQDSSEVTSKRHPPRSKDPRAAGVIPYLGVFLTDLVMLDSAIRDHLETGYLNFEKRRKEFESLSHIRLLQSVCLGYRFDTDPQFVSWFRRLQPISEDDSYRLSCDIEPTQDTVSNTTPVRPTVIITHCTDLLASIVAPFGPGLHLVSWDSPCERLMTPSLSQQHKSPSVPALDTLESPKQTLKGFPSAGTAGRTHRRSASCGSTIISASQNSGPLNHAADLHASSDPTGDHRIIRVRVEPAEENSVYKSVRVSARISSQEKAPVVIDRILRKHHIDTQGQHELVQLLPGGKELIIPGTANVFYAMSSASLDFLLRPQQPARPPLSPTVRHATRMQISATFPKVKAKAGDLARVLF